MSGGGRPKQATCAICSEPIVRAALSSKRDTRKYCSLTCRQEAVRRINRSSYARHSVERSALSRAWQERNPERSRANVRAYQASHPDKAAAWSRKARLKFKYGLTPDDFDRMNEAQSGLCAICSLPEASRSRSGQVQPLSVDHDHETGLVRGLLCRRCNAVLGWIESPGKLDAALSYLRLHEQKAREVA